MKKLTLTTAFLLWISCLLASNANPAAQQLLVTSMQQASLFHDGDPLELDVDFVAQMSVPVPGHLTLKWEAKDRWWRRTVMGIFEQTEVRNGDRLYTSRNTSSTPVRIRELISLLQFAEGADELLAQNRSDVSRTVSN